MITTAQTLRRCHLPGLLVLLMAASPGLRGAPGDDSLAAYFAEETRKLAQGPLAEIHSPEAWRVWRGTARRELQEMLGLLPFPERTPLQPVVTGRTETEDVLVERLHFQSLPRLYVTANLYLPREREGRVPAILYVCGHGRVRKDGIDYGNKVHYQHHALWFARHGYACLTLDTIQLGEISGIHHGTYREGMWWWNSRGYTPAGVEAWNGIRALDYLQSRTEVDGERIGITGRSGGGAYSWWVSALDDRVKAVAPVAGITDLENHVVDGVVEGHCDCMYMVNTHRWDYPEVAALVAPRPLLIVNTDSDSIFPLDGVVRTFAALRPLYRVLERESALGLVVGPGPHKDTQDLRVPVFHWMNQHLKPHDPLIEEAARPQFEPEDLKVFGSLPEDERTSTIHESFVARADPPPVIESARHWIEVRNRWRQALEERCFAGWPASAGRPEVKRVEQHRAGGFSLTRVGFASQEHVPLRLYVLESEAKRPESRVLVQVLSDPRFPRAPKPPEEDVAGEEVLLAPDGVPTTYRTMLEALSPLFGDALEEERAAHGDLAGRRGEQWMALRSEALRTWSRIVFCLPRGTGHESWNADTRKQIQIRRRFMLLGQTLDGMRVWDIRRAVELVERLPGTRRAGITLRGNDWMAVNALYASLFLPGVERLTLTGLPMSHRNGPDYLNVLRYLDIPQVVAMAVERTSVSLRVKEAGPFEWVHQASEVLGWAPDRFQVEPIL